jgi:hypothetical protein
VNQTRPLPPETASGSFCPELAPETYVHVVFLTVCIGCNLCRPSATYVYVGFGQRRLLAVAIGDELYPAS